MLLLGIILLPTAAVFGAVLGWRLVKARKLYRFIGMFAGLVILPAFCIIILGRIFPNKAEAENKKFIKGISALHPRLICDDGDSGYGPDNSTPWYTAYYFIDANTNVQNIIEQSAGHIGIQLTKDNSYIQQLKEQGDEAPLGDETYNPHSIYLTGGGLQLTVAKDGSIPTWCQNRWNQQEAVKPGAYILYSSLSK